MRSNLARIGIVALLLLGSVGCHDTPTPTAPETKAVSKVPPKPTIASDCVPPEGPVDRPGYCSYPADIRAFIDARDACDHWRGEPWPEDMNIRDKLDKEIAVYRRKQITDAIKATCTGTDKRLSALKTAYANDPKVMQLLDEYEADIEAGD